MSETKFLVGVDVGSTTVKAVVVEAATDKMIWSDYQRHETKQPEKTLELLKEIEDKTGVRAGNTRMFITGSGGGGIGARVGAKSAVTKDIGEGQHVAGVPAGPVADWRESAVLLRRLPELRQALSDLQSRLAALEARMKP